MTTIQCARRVYRYWRQQGLSPADARFQVGACIFARVAHRERVPA